MNRFFRNLPDFVLAYSGCIVAASAAFVALRIAFYALTGT